MHKMQLCSCTLRRQVLSLHISSNARFLSRVSTLTRDIDIVINSVCLSVCLSVCPSVRPSARPSVRDTLVLYENGSTYRHNDDESFGTLPVADVEIHDLSLPSLRLVKGLMLKS